MSVGQKIRVLVADDTALYRKILTMAIGKIPSAQIIGAAQDGIAALDILKKQKADLVLLDVCMPRMDGVEALKEIHRLYPRTAVVMFSGVTTADADTTLEALEIGALEFIPKPKTRSLEESMSLISHELTRIVRLLKIRKISSRVAQNTASTRLGKTVSSSDPTKRGQASVCVSEPRKVIPPKPRRVMSFDPSKSLIVIGVSTGGPNALNQLMSMMPKNIGCPILIVQHMPPFFTASLATFLSKKTGLNISEGVDGEMIKPDHVYIAPGGKHMVLKKANAVNSSYHLSMNEDPPVNSCRPAVDVMFKSVADGFNGPILSIILTGMGEDGADGVAYLKKTSNLYSISQDESSCVVYGMPRAVAERGLVDEVLPLNQIAPRVSELFLRRKVV